MNKTCSECGFEFPEEICYRSNISGLIVCANCIAKKRKENMLKLKFPVHYRPSQIRAMEIQKLKSKKIIS